MTASESPQLLTPGVVVDGRYQIVREIGRGGMGTVYEAHHLKLDRPVALKIVQLDSAFGDASNLLHRFAREARAAASIKHRNVIDTFDFGDLDDGSTYYVMEFIQGRNLAWLLRHEGPFPWPRVRGWLVQILGALAEAHAKGIIHRDIKPANIMLLDEPDEMGNEWIKVLDFGIAKVQAADEQSMALTGTSELLGTATHMAPEVAQGERPDARADLYAVGIVAYQLLTGTVPFYSDNMFKMLSMHIAEPPPPLRRHVPSIPAAVEALVLRTLAKAPADRHPDAHQMAKAIEALGDAPSEPPSAPPPSDSAVSTVLLDSGAPVPSAPLPPAQTGQTIAVTPAEASTMLALPTPAPIPRAPDPSPKGSQPLPTPRAPMRSVPRPPTSSGVPVWIVIVVIAIVGGIAIGMML